MKFSLSNVGAQNTPVSIRVVGNWLLLIGLIGTGLTAYHVQNPEAYFPAFLTGVSGIMAIFGTIGKIITMFFGVSKPEELEKLVDSSNKALNKTTGNSIATDPLKITPAGGLGS